MRTKSQIIISIILIAIITSTLCFGDDPDEAEPPRDWRELKRFNEFIESNFTTTIKEESGSEMIQDITEPLSTLYIAVGIDEPFTELESVALFNFVEAGGNLIVASDNCSNVNSLAGKFGLKYNDHAVIYKKGYFDYNYTFLPVIVEINASSFHILVHSPRGLDLTEKNIEILAESATEPQRIISVLDLNDNIGIDAADRPGPIPIIVQVTINEGRAIFISDASMFPDPLWKVTSNDTVLKGQVYENREFIKYLVNELYPANGKLIYDKSKQTAGTADYYVYPPKKKD